MMQEFLCLSDQKKLIEVDNIRIKELVNHNVEFHQLKTEVQNFTSKCLNYGKGLGRFKISSNKIDYDYLDNRDKLL